MIPAEKKKKRLREDNEVRNNNKKKNKINHTKMRKYRCGKRCNHDDDNKLIKRQQIEKTTENLAQTTKICTVAF